MPESEDNTPAFQRPTWSVRPYRPGDIEGLLRLYSEVFGRERSEEELRWKLLRPGYGVDTLWVAEAGGRVVGQHAGIPMRLKLGDRTVNTVHAVEAMTQRDFRREGMLTDLGGGLYDHWRENGIPLILGLPHEGWGTRAYALGYRPAFPMRWLSRPLRPLAILASKLYRQRSNVPTSRHGDVPTSQRSGGIEVRQVERTGPQFDRLWEWAGQSYVNAVVRDAEWVHWRYFGPPGAPFTVLIAAREDRIVGYIVYRTVELGGRVIGRIADLFTRPDDAQAIGALLRHALADVRARGADSAVILVAAGTSLYGAARRHGFLLNRGEYQASFIRLSDEIDTQSLNDPRNWLLTGGDFDVV